MEHSIAHIIDQYGKSIFKICLGYVKSVEDAEDVVQEVYINIWKGLKTFRQEANIRTWIYRITVNTCLLRLRKKSIQTVALDSIEYSLPLQQNDKIQFEESFLLLHKYIQQLDEKERVIALLYLEGLSHKEIAKVVGITPNYVGVKINRIKNFLTDKFKNNG